MLYVEFWVDNEPCELELHPGMVYEKCAKCGQKIYGYIRVGDETEMLCEACTPPPPDPKKMIIENLEKHLGITFTEDEMDYWFEKGDAKSAIADPVHPLRHFHVQLCLIPECSISNRLEHGRQRHLLNRRSTVIVNIHVFLMRT